MRRVEVSSSRLLIVDDQQSNVELLQRILALEGYQTVVGTTDSREALPLCRTFDPDLVLLDLHMPHMAGNEIIEGLRDTRYEAYLPILVLTADITPEAKRRALQVGASDFLTKPFDVTEVLLRVRNLLETRFLYLQVQAHNTRLEETVRVRTRALEAAQMDLVRKNQELSVALAKASEVAELKSQFLANINHEIRTPINGIVGMINLLDESELNSDQRECTEMLKSSADWLLKVMNDILDVSQLGSGRARVEHRVFDPRSLLEELSGRHGKQAHAKGIEFSASVSPETPRIVAGDPSRLRRILDQLLSNAVKFTDSGRITVDMQTVEQTDGTVTARFVVEDTGVGITGGHSSRLFEPFVQGDGSATRKHGGIGLGLTLAKQLVESLGGQIGLEPTRSGGTRAWFTMTVEKLPTGVQCEQASL